MKPPRSLKARALQLLAQREQSRVELRRKLLAHAKAEDAKAEWLTQDHPESLRDGASGAPYGAASNAACECLDAPSRVETVLDWLESRRFSSDERFAESRINARVARYGNLRIRQELKQHAVSLTPEAARSLNDSELARAVAVYLRRFPDAPATPAERAKHGRFLVARGFSADAVQRALRSRRDDNEK